VFFVCRWVFVNSLREMQSVSNNFRGRLTGTNRWSEILRQCVHCFPCVNVIQLKTPAGNCHVRQSLEKNLIWFFILGLILATLLTYGLFATLFHGCTYFKFQLVLDGLLIFFSLDVRSYWFIIIKFLMWQILNQH